VEIEIRPGYFWHLHNYLAVRFCDSGLKSQTMVKWQIRADFKQVMVMHMSQTCVRKKPEKKERFTYH
jgi:hypothetical protein